MFFEWIFNSSWFWITVILSAIITGALTSLVADNKGYNSTNWFFTGLLFGLFGLIAAAGLQPNKVFSQYEKKCPKCKGLINPTASICQYCRTEFSNEELIKDIIDKESVLFSQKNNSDIINLIFTLNDIMIDDVVSYIFEKYTEEEHVKLKLQLISALMNSDIYNKDQIMNKIIHQIAGVDIKMLLLKKYPQFKNTQQ